MGIIISTALDATQASRDAGYLSGVFTDLMFKYFQRASFRSLLKVNSMGYSQIQMQINCTIVRE